MQSNKQNDNTNKLSKIVYMVNISIALKKVHEIPAMMLIQQLFNKCRTTCELALCWFLKHSKLHFTIVNWVIDSNSLTIEWYFENDSMYGRLFRWSSIVLIYRDVKDILCTMQKKNEYIYYNIILYICWTDLQKHVYR